MLKPIRSRHISLALILLAATLLIASSASASGPATVSVRVEGLNGATVLPQTQVTTTTASISVAGGTCSGTSAGGALYDATHGNWIVKNDGASLGLEIDGIGGLNFPAFSEGPDAYWSFWLNNTFAEQGACSQEVNPGDDVVFFAACDALGSDCPTSATTPEHFLTLSAPTSTSVQVGTPISVTVGSIGTGSGTAESTLPAATTVVAGTVNATPNAQGTALFTFTTPGTYTLQADAPGAVPSDTRTVCVHNGNDGNCGTPAPPGTQQASTTTTSGTVSAYVGPYAVVAHSISVTEGHIYPHGHGPRTLTGSVAAHAGLTAVSVELRRSYHGHCSAYEGTRERFVAAACGHGSFFKVSNSSSFSYLLPTALAPGRYVLDIQATDAAGNHTTLARGSTRTVFYVR
jgi:hypothetical protein